MTTRSTGSVLFLTAIAAASMIACSVSTTETPTSGTKNGTSSSSSSSSGGTTSSSSGGDDESTATTSATTCAAKSGYEACMDCCTDNKPEALKAGGTAFNTCLCGASGVCKTECATDMCATDPNAAQESAACADCMKAKGEPCIEAADKACEADAACKAASACADAAKCEEKE